MLEELRITGLGVIYDTTLRLTSGMNVITGETGAGKTMVVTGLGLLFGGRADTGRVRADPGRAVVEGRLRLTGPLADAVTGRITDASTGHPVVGARITLADGGRSLSRLDGRFLLAGAPAGDVLVTVSAPGHEDAARTVAMGAVGPGSLDVALSDVAPPPGSCCAAATREIRKIMITAAASDWARNLNIAVTLLC